MVMVGLQVVLMAFDLLLPFLTGTYVNFGTTDFLMAYFFALLDFFLLLGFLRGAKWAFIFGLLFSGINVTVNLYNYLNNPVMLYVVLIIIRAAVLVCLRDSNVRIYMDMKKVGSKKVEAKKLKK